MTDKDERWKPGGSYTDKECIWCGKQTCRLVKARQNVAKYHCENCGKDYWA